jgi:hypothetical protein
MAEEVDYREFAFLFMEFGFEVFFIEGFHETDSLHVNVEFRCCETT